MLRRHDLEQLTLRNNMTEKKRGRPAIVLDTGMIEKLASLQCTINDVAFVMGCHRDTIRKNYLDHYELGKAQGRIKLRQAMFTNATERHSAAVQIFLAKNLLGMSDVPIDEGDNGILPWETPTTKEDDDD